MVRKDVLNGFHSVVLAYSGPPLGGSVPGPTPDNFYNPFPDMNDPANDGVRAVFPRRAKYSLTLDSLYLPAAEYVFVPGLNTRIIHFPPAAQLQVQDVEEIQQQPDDQMFIVPRSPEMKSVLDFERLFELVHQRLGATAYKHALRSFVIAPFYATLERAILDGRTIDVPLIGYAAGTSLQRQWWEITRLFEATRPIDEAISLLAGVVHFSDHEWASREDEWIAEQEAENKGFADYYMALRNTLGVRASVRSGDKWEITERIVQYGKQAYTPGQQTIFPALPVIRKGEGQSARRQVSWPSLVFEEDRDGPDHLRASWRGKGASIPGAVQQLLAAHVLHAESRKGFSAMGEDRWPQYVHTEPTTAKAHHHRATSALRGLVNDAFAEPDGRAIDHSTACDVAQYFVFLESMRQQLATGVGLRCPFWDGEYMWDWPSCCPFLTMLERVYKVTKPLSVTGTHHWKRPPCMGTPRETAARDDP